MYIEMAKRAEISSQDSVDSVLFDFFNLIRVGGFRVAEYTQKTQTKINEFEHGSGNKVINSLSAKSVLAGEKLLATYSIST
jgi:hypothetical protein